MLAAVQKSIMNPARIARLAQIQINSPFRSRATTSMGIKIACDLQKEGFTVSTSILRPSRRSDSANDRACTSRGSRSSTSAVLDESGRLASP
jgi:hypothetical protein